MKTKIDGYERLGNAVVAKAASDYRKCLRRLHDNPNDKCANREARRIEEFFNDPDRIGIFTRLNGAELLLDIQKDAEERNYELPKRERDED